MNQLVKILVTIGSSASIGFGIWHFFVPNAWRWYSYMDRNATELVAAVRAINAFFSLSLVLFGIVNILLIYGGRSNRYSIIVWIIGYVLGIALVYAVPTSIVGWIIMPIGVLITLWVLLTRVKGATFTHFIVVAVVWTLIAILFDYLFIVQAFKPADGYYKLDVYLYYALTFILPIAIGWRKRAKPMNNGLP